LKVGKPNPVLVPTVRLRRPAAQLSRWARTEARCYIADR
jgi:hypothetical protein